MKLNPRESVIFAEDYKAMVDWYQEVLGFKVIRQFDQGYRYTNLETESGIRIGIVPAEEMDVKPGDRRQNTVLLQVEVADVAKFLTYLKEKGGAVTFGPSFDKDDGFWYGGFQDLEGNPFWVVDENCP